MTWGCLSRMWCTISFSTTSQLVCRQAGKARSSGEGRCPRFAKATGWAVGEGVPCGLTGGSAAGPPPARLPPLNLAAPLATSQAYLALVYELERQVLAALHVYHLPYRAKGSLAQLGHLARGMASSQ